MGDQPRGDHKENASEDSVADPFPSREAEISSALNSHETNQANGSEEGGDRNHRPARYFFPRLTINEFLTLVLSAVSLVIAALTYRNAADTSDIKAAIRNLTDLAAQTERQADAAGGQLTEMRDEQRPWIRVVPQIKGALTNSDGALSTVAELSVRNLGRRPAISVTGKAAISVGPTIFKSQSPSKDDIVSLCEEKVDPFLGAFLGEPGNDVIFPDSDGVIDVIADEREPDIGMGQKKFIPLARSNDFVVKDSNLELIFCVTYKEIGNNIPHHTGGAVSISIPPGTETIKNGQNIPVGLLKLERVAGPMFSARAYAD